MTFQAALLPWIFFHTVSLHFKIVTLSNMLVSEKVFQHISIEYFYFMFIHIWFQSICDKFKIRKCNDILQRNKWDIYTGNRRHSNNKDNIIYLKDLITASILQQFVV